ncbi:DUF397 domain-containing protein [Saccharopolyspora gregorii]
MPTGWRTSTRSHQHSDCVEVGRAGGGAAVRDSKDRAAGHFTATGAQWAAFLRATKDGRFDG